MCYLRLGFKPLKHGFDAAEHLSSRNVGKHMYGALRGSW